MPNQDSLLGLRTDYNHLFPLESQQNMEKYSEITGFPNVFLRILVRRRFQRNSCGILEMSSRIYRI